MSAVAVPVRTSRTKAVELDLEPTVRAAVEERLAASTMLHAATDGEAAVARISADGDGDGDGALIVHDSGGFAVQDRTFAADPAGIARMTGMGAVPAVVSLTTSARGRARSRSCRRTASCAAPR